MSDFLQRLVVRTLKPAATIRPLLERGVRPPAAIVEAVPSDPLLPDTACREPSLSGGRVARGPNGAVEPSQTKAFPAEAGSALQAQLKEGAQVRREQVAPHEDEARQDALVRPPVPPPPAPPIAPGLLPVSHSLAPDSTAALGRQHPIHGDSAPPIESRSWSTEPSRPNAPPQPSVPSRPTLDDQPSPNNDRWAHSAPLASASVPTPTAFPELSTTSEHKPVPSFSPSGAAPTVSVALPPSPAEAFRQSVRAARAASAEKAIGGRLVGLEPTLSVAAGHEFKTLAPISAARAEAHAATPSVQVTIGRVEVRAVVSQPAHAALRRQSGPRLSLDEYLKQRDSSRR